MAKCTCKNCNHQWSEKDPMSCPECGKTDFEIKEGDKIPWKIIGIIAGVLFIIILLLKCGGSDKVTATVTFKQSIGSLKVELDISNSDKKDFKIQLLRGGTLNSEAKAVKSKTFVGLMPGTYYVEVKYIGKGKAPEIVYDKIKGPFTIDEISTSVSSVSVRIVKIKTTENKKTQRWTISVQIMPDTLCEYSSNGIDFQDSKQFVLLPGTYTISARLKEDNSNIDSMSVSLDKITNEPPPTKEKIQGLLNQISNDVSGAFNNLKSLVNTGGIRVTGVDGINTLFELMVDCNNGSKYTITNITITNDQIISIDVRKN